MTFTSICDDADCSSSLFSVCVCVCCVVLVFSGFDDDTHVGCFNPACDVLAIARGLLFSQSPVAPAIVTNRSMPRTSLPYLTYSSGWMSPTDGAQAAQMGPIALPR